MMEILSKAHNIISISQEAIPEGLKGHTLIVYLPERDMIVLAGWGENMVLMAELIKTYLELTPQEHERAMEAPVHVGMSGIDLKIWQTLDEIYRIRNSHKE